MKQIKRLFKFTKAQIGCRVSGLVERWVIKPLSKLPRWMHRLYANINGYFWLPCPMCGDYFGGHEWKSGNSLYYAPGRGKGVCANCGEEAKKQNLENYGMAF